LIRVTERFCHAEQGLPDHSSKITGKEGSQSFQLLIRILTPINRKEKRSGPCSDIDMGLLTGFPGFGMAAISPGTDSLRLPDYLGLKSFCLKASCDPGHCRPESGLAPLPNRRTLEAFVGGKKIDLPRYREPGKNLAHRSGGTCLLLTVDCYLLPFFKAYPAPFPQFLPA
jgi:hypothetical protein